MKQKVSIQGFEGSFHQIAAQQFFGNNITILPCATFRQVVQQTQNGTSAAGVMAIENSIAGSILPNYNLLHHSELQISGEVYLPIQQHLLACKGVGLHQITEVHSHPMAILQCINFLSTRNWKLVETEDTALSAQNVAKQNSTHVAAIAGRLAASLFNLQVLQENIHAEENNYTRFLILEKNRNKMQDGNKASISFHTSHQRGSLARVLTQIAEAEINLSKLQSFPIPGSNWQYMFHADLEFTSSNQFYKVLQKLHPITEAIRVFGLYKSGQKI